MPRDIDKVRFYVGDTTSADPLFSDQEIQFALSESGNVRMAASLCATKKAAEWSRLADLKEGQLSIAYSQRSKQMLAIAEALQEVASLVDPPMPSAGGVFVSDKETTEEDDSLVQPAFSVDMLDNKFVGGLSRQTINQELE
jgi:hypothetical protein